MTQLTKILVSLYAWLKGSPMAVAALALVASAAVDSMPAPTSKSSGFYVWLYGLSHAILLHADKFKFSLAVPAASPVPTSGSTPAK